MKTVKTLNPQTSEEVITLLRRIHEGPEVQSRRDVSLIYRGVGSEHFNLLPSAFRLDGKRRLDQILREKGDEFDDLHIFKDLDINGNVAQEICEYFVICEFYSMANMQGLKLPTDSASLHGEFLSKVIGLDNLFSVKHRFNSDKEKWPQLDLLPMIALAQHYGIPTRILDWSHNPFVAAYFAATSAIREIEREKDGPGHFAIWCVNKIKLSASALFDYHKEITRPSYSVRTIDIPHNGNPNLRAQQGTFTVVFRRDKQDDNDEVDQMTVDEAMRQIYKDLDGNERREVVFPKNSPELFTQIRIPVNEAKPLLKRLYILGYHSASIFPGFQGCADALFELADNH